MICRISEQVFEEINKTKISYLIFRFFDELKDHFCFNYDIAFMIPTICSSKNAMNA